MTLAGRAAVARGATALPRAESQRHIWAVDDQARAEVGDLAGVRWARVDVVARRAAMRFDPVLLCVPDLTSPPNWKSPDERTPPPVSSPRTRRLDGEPIAHVLHSRDDRLRGVRGDLVPCFRHDCAVRAPGQRSEMALTCHP